MAANIVKMTGLLRLLVALAVLHRAFTTANISTDPTPIQTAAAHFPRMEVDFVNAEDQVDHAKMIREQNKFIPALTIAVEEPPDTAKATAAVPSTLKAPGKFIPSIPFEVDETAEDIAFKRGYAFDPKVFSKGYHHESSSKSYIPEVPLHVPEANHNAVLEDITPSLVKEQPVKVKNSRTRHSENLFAEFDGLPPSFDEEEEDVSEETVVQQPVKTKSELEEEIENTISEMAPSLIDEQPIKVHGKRSRKVVSTMKVVKEDIAPAKPDEVDSIVAGLMKSLVKQSPVKGQGFRKKVVDLEANVVPTKKAQKQVEEEDDDAVSQDEVSTLANSSFEEYSVKPRGSIPDKKTKKKSQKDIIVNLDKEFPLSDGITPTLEPTADPSTTNVE